MSAAGVFLTGIEKRFGALVAVRPLDLTVPAGSFFSIIGPSGCGKTTTLRMVAGLETPDAGRIEVGGRDVTRVPAHRRPVNTVFQSYALFPHLNLFENVAFGLREARTAREELRRRVAEAIELVRLTGREGARPRQLSGGQQQRVALARALVNRPDVLLLDEPLGALDLKLRRELQEQLKEIQHAVGTTFVYVTHDQEEAFAMSDGVAVMNAGRLEQVGRPEDVYRRPVSLFVANFVGSSNRLAGEVVEVRDGFYVLRLESGERLEAPGQEGLGVGAAAVAIVRPEEVAFGSEGYPAAVEDVTYLGPQRHLRVRAERIGELLATVSGHDAAPDPGARVAVRWSRDAAWLVPAS